MHSETLPQPAASPAILRELGAFLRRPAVLEPLSLRSVESWRALAILALLHIAVLLGVILPGIALWQKQFALPLPNAFEALSEGWLVPITVLAAPVMEEIAFRGWQRGWPRVLWLLACLIAGVALLALGSQIAPLTRGLLLLGVLVAALAGWLVLRKHRQPVRGYEMAYPVIFWLAALGFALAHLTNYPSASLLALPMVLPQLWAGALLGFTRQRLGLPASILQHAAANAAALALTMAG